MTSTIAIVLLLLALPFRAPGQFSADRALAHLTYIAKDIGPRPMGSPAEQRALAYVRDRFRDAGCDTAFIMPFARTPEYNTSSGIAVGISYGPSSRSICIGSHIDSEGPEVEGANDNASGTAVVLELARVLTGTPHHSTLIFCAFGGEEKGLLGSTYFAEQFDSIGTIDMMIQLDMADGAGPLELDPHTYGTSAPQWLVRAAFEEADRLSLPGFIYPTHAYVLNYLTPIGASSDQGPFLTSGIPAIALISDVNYPIHTPQDVLGHFTASGLARSGKLTEALVRRFDGGIPERTTDTYLLFVVGPWKIFLTTAMLLAWIVLATGLGLTALIILRRRREREEPERRIRWSTFKGICFTMLVIVYAWYAPGLLGIMKGIEIPWYAHPRPYWWLAAGFALIGVWFAARIESRFPLTTCPYLLFRRTYILLTLGILISLPFGLNLAFYPAAALLFLSIALFLRPAMVRILFFAVAAYFPVRLIASPWMEFWSRIVGVALSAGQSAVLTTLGTFVLLTVFLAILLPLLFGGLALVRETPALRRSGQILRSGAFLGTTLIVAAALTVITLQFPSYNNLWQARVTVTDRYSLDTGSREVRLRSPEFLSGITIHRMSGDTTLAARETSLLLDPSPSFDTTLLQISRVVGTDETDSVTTSVVLGLRSRERPLSVRLSYCDSAGKELRLESPWGHTTESDTLVLEWTAYPDSILSIPVTLHRRGRTPVIEKLEVTYGRLADPMTLERQFTSFIPRTIVTATHIYAP